MLSKNKIPFNPGIFNPRQPTTKDHFPFKCRGKPEAVFIFDFPTANCQLLTDLRRRSAHKTPSTPQLLNSSTSQLKTSRPFDTSAEEFTCRRHGLPAGGTADT